MNKGKTKVYDAKKAEVIRFIAKQFEVTEGYVRQCVAGTSNTGRAEEIVRAYRLKYKEVKQILS